MRVNWREHVANRGATTFSIMLANIMQGIDTTIANLALPHIQGSLSASQHQISWVLNSHIVAAAIMTPLTGSLAGFGISTCSYFRRWRLGSFSAVRERYESHRTRRLSRASGICSAA